MRETKAAVAALDTTNASALAQGRSQASGFIEATNHRAILPRAAMKIPLVGNPVANVQSVTAVAQWVGQNNPKPVNQLGVNAANLQPKLAVDLVVSEELIRFSRLDTLMWVEGVAVSAVRKVWNDSVLDTVAASAARPAGLLNGLTGLTPVPTDPATAVGFVFNNVSGGAPEKPVVITNIQMAARLAPLRLESVGITVIASPAAGSRLIGLDAEAVGYVDDGGQLSISRNADVEMRDDPTATASATVVLVSTFQRNLAVVRAERWVNWTARRCGRVSDNRVMSKPRQSPPMDPGLAQIASLERNIIAAHDERAQMGVSAEELARQRPGVVALARPIADRMRREYLARKS